MNALLAMAFIASLASCSASVGPAAPDMGPVGDGLKVIGFSLIGVAVVITVGRTFR